MDRSLLFAQLRRTVRAIAFVVALASGTVRAADYGVVGNTELFLLKDFRVDFEIRIALILQARHSIDFVTYSQNTDPINMEFLRAIRKVQTDRNVAVRGIYDAMVSQGDKEKNKAVMNVLTDAALECPGEVMCAHPIEKLSSGISIFDYIHEKIMIIDAGTPHEVIFFSGRGTTISSAQFIDAGFLIRRIDSAKPYAGDAMKSIYQSLWDSLKKLASKSVLKMPSRSGRPLDEEIDLVRKRFVETPEERRLAAEILDVLRRPAAVQSAEKLKAFQFQPEKMNVLSNDLFKQLIEGKDIRAAFFNDNHATLIKDVRSFTGTLEMTAYSFAPPQEMHEALVDFIRRGNTLNIFTNGAPAWVTANPAVWKQGFPAYYTYESVVKLLDDTKGASGKVNVFLVNPEEAKKNGLATWVHRKLVTFRNALEGRDEFAYVGSDNFTWSAAKKNDEMLVKVSDRRFTESMIDLTETERVGYEKIDEDALRKLYKSRPLIYRCLRLFVKTNF